MRELYPISSGSSLSGSLSGGSSGSGVLSLPATVCDPVSADRGGDESSAADAACWYALTVKHQHERPIEAALAHKGFEAFAPMYRSRRQWSDRTKEIDLPLFAGYVFCRFPHQAKARVLNTPAIWRMVEFGGRPAAVPDADIEAIRTIVNSRLPVRPWPHLKPGDRVRVEHGPLRGVEGVLLKEKDAVELIVSVELLQRSIAVRIEATSVVPVAGAHLRL
jgi:transcription antitermination factor NusG